MYSKIPYARVGRDCEGLYILIYERVMYGTKRDNRSKGFHAIQSYPVPYTYKRESKIDYSMSNNLIRGLYYA